MAKRPGIIFRPGNFGAVTTKEDLAKGNKGNYTEADMDRLAASVSGPVPVRMGHQNTLLDGKLGQVTSVFAGWDEKGQKCLFGEWEEPEPLAALLGDRPRTISAEINPLDMSLHAVALEINPHIKDAAFFAQAVEEAYAKFSKGETVTPLATFAFESSAERDAIDTADFADPDNRLFPVRTQDELRAAMREVWNASDPLAVMGNIRKIGERKGLDLKTDFYPMYARAGMSAPLNETPPVRPYDSYFSQETNMRFFVQNGTGYKLASPDELVTFTGGAVPARIENIFVEIETGGQLQRATPEQVVAATAGRVKFSGVVADPETEALRQKLAKFEADAAAAKVQGIDAAAEAHFTALLEKNLVLPGQKEEVVAAFTVAGRFDADRETLAYFSAESPVAKFSMTEFLNSVMGKLKPHNLTTEQVNGLTPEQLAVFDQQQSTVKDEKTGEISKVVEQRTNDMFAKPGGAE